MRSRTSLTILVSAIVVGFLILAAGCKSAATQDRIDPTIVPQLRSFSSSGADQASLVVENDRELRITKDGGLTWQASPSSAVGEAFETATMLNAQRGWAISHEGHVFTTDTGGAKWTKISELKDFTCANQMVFLNEKDGWIRECLMIWRTRDGGVTWQEMLSVVTPGVLGQPTGMFAFDANTIIVSGSEGQFYSTQDGGVTWKINSPVGGDRIDYSDVWFVDRKHGWLVGNQIIVAGESSRALVLETADGGESWKLASAPADVFPSSVCFVGNDGWLAGARRIVNGDSVRLEGVLLHTVDGGNSWEQVELGPDEPYLNDVRFVDQERGWLVGRDSLYRTGDSGKTWTRVLSLPPLRFSKLPGHD
jgi:photosystem II stability/assembly factor-like uncharacterized protein